MPVSDEVKEFNEPSESDLSVIDKRDLGRLIEEIEYCESAMGIYRLKKRILDYLRKVK